MLAQLGSLQGSSSFLFEFLHFFGEGLSLHDQELDLDYDKELDLDDDWELDLDDERELDLDDDWELDLDDERELDFFAEEPRHDFCFFHHWHLFW